MGGGNRKALKWGALVLSGLLVGNQGSEATQELKKLFLLLDRSQSEGGIEKF